jgi:hypothetical protein
MHSSSSNNTQPQKKNQARVYQQETKQAAEGKKAQGSKDKSRLIPGRISGHHLLSPLWKSLLLNLFCLSTDSFN